MIQSTRRAPQVITLNRPDVIALIEQAASRLTGGNKTEAVALAMRRLLQLDTRTGSLFGAHPGPVKPAGAEAEALGKETEGET